jgi:hypothetical protein
MPEELPSLMPEESPSQMPEDRPSQPPEQLLPGRKTKLALAIAEGQSVASWARSHGVPRRTAFTWARDPDVRRAVQAIRRRYFDRTIGQMAKRTIWASGLVARLAESASSESVQLSALRSIFSDVIAISRFSDLDFRVSELEERRRAQPGKPSRSA